MLDDFLYFLLYIRSTFEYISKEIEATHLALCNNGRLGHRYDFHGIRYELLWFIGCKMVPWSRRSRIVNPLRSMH
jgi:hypothetical protein